MRVRVPALVAAAPLVLLSACGGDEPPTRPQDIEAGPTCKTTGTIEAEPARNLRAAVEPYLEPGHKLEIQERFADTAEVRLDSGQAGPDPATVTLVKTGQGWVVTSISRC